MLVHNGCGGSTTVNAGALGPNSFVGWLQVGQYPGDEPAQLCAAVRNKTLTP